ncbi:MAG: hypothetical protein ABIK85_08645, partial [Candidatus Eisenbacteria bacterium]
MRHLRSWLPALARLSLVLLSVLACSTAHAFLYDTFSAGPGFPNRIDDYIDALPPLDTVDIIVDFCSTP